MTTLPSTGEPDPQSLQAAWDMYQRGQYAEASSRFHSLAERGSPSAALYLGYMYQSGVGVSRDREKARAHYLKAANAGSAEGQYYLGALLQQANDLKGAEAWYKKAVEQMDDPASRALPQSPQGALLACVKLGYMHHRGLGVPLDLENARECYLKAAQAGSAEGQNYLAALYRERGELTEALRWYEKAAQASHASANYWAYVMYERGEGSRRDAEKAQRYLLTALQLGHVYAQRARAMQLIKGAEGFGGALKGLGMFVSSLSRGFRIAYRDPASLLIH